MEPVKENAPNAREIVNSERIVAEHLNSCCFYKLDGKYSTEYQI